MSAWRECRRLTAARTGTTSVADIDNPVAMARVTGAELLRQLRAEADRVAGIADWLREAADTVTDSTAAEQRATEVGRRRADAAAEEMATELSAAQAFARQAETA